MIFSDQYRNKKVLVTGHTGFKGSWLCAWLCGLGAEVVGISNEIPTQPALFDVLGLEKKVKHYVFDLLDAKKTEEVLNAEKPDFIFHLAAQAIVSTSYKEPLRTLATNIMGTAHVLEAVRKFEHKTVVVSITSDKCYENVEWCWGYKESDALGGKDIYSASKAGAENVIHAYFESYLKSKSNIRLASVRAGNVIGGGDWAQDRIVVDTVKAWASGETVSIRSPDATRPWQHVLEPLSGYLLLGMKLWLDHSLNGEAFNFGPRTQMNKTVVDLLNDMAQLWGIPQAKAYQITEHKPFHEAGLLKLNCDKALFHLKWQATLDYKETVEYVVEWYKNFYILKNQDMYAVTQRQIEHFCENAKKQKQVWIG